MVAHSVFGLGFRDMFMKKMKFESKFKTMDITKLEIKKNRLKSNIVCNGLYNPRGLSFTKDGDLLLIEAGRSEFKPPFSGQLTRRDRSNGKIKETLLHGYQAMNMQSRMLRDEIMGLADIAFTEKNTPGEESWLISFTDYVNGSKIIEVQGGVVLPVFETRGNINSLCYHPKRNAWYCIKPDTNEVLEFVRSRVERVVCVLPDLALGQEAVPVNVVFEPSSGNILISLFSGELGRGDELKGIDFEKRQGAIVSVVPETGEVETLVTGLTLPTGLCLSEDGKLLVTELCDEFLQPLPADHIPEEPLHGGFKRFSGRLLSIDIQNSSVEELAIGLDTPSNLAVYEQDIYVSEGMGLPGRPIPGVDDNKLLLEGFIRKFQV